jgi:TonB family protein
MRRFITGDLTVQVLVDIDARGTVTKATFMNSNAPTSRMLAPAVIAAATQSRFRPARVRGQDVASQMVLTFRFGR